MRIFLVVLKISEPPSFPINTKAFVRELWQVHNDYDDIFGEVCNDNKDISEEVFNDGEGFVEEVSDDIFDSLSRSSLHCKLSSSSISSSSSLTSPSSFRFCICVRLKLIFLTRFQICWRFDSSSRSSLQQQIIIIINIIIIFSDITIIIQILYLYYRLNCICVFVFDIVFVFLSFCILSSPLYPPPGNERVMSEISLGLIKPMMMMTIFYSNSQKSYLWF